MMLFAVFFLVTVGKLQANDTVSSVEDKIISAILEKCKEYSGFLSLFKDSPEKMARTALLQHREKKLRQGVNINAVIFDKIKSKSYGYPDNYLSRSKIAVVVTDIVNEITLGGSVGYGRTTAWQSMSALPSSGIRL